jgi:hypothetical protein
LASFLKALHTTTNPEFIAALGGPIKTTPKRIATVPNENGIISKGARNVTTFDLMRHYAYPIAWKFISAPGALTQHLFEKFSVINAERCSPPLPVGEIRLSAHSVEKFSVEKRFVKPTRQINSRSWTDEDRAWAHLIKYGPNHVTNKEVATTKGVCERTVIRRKKKTEEAAAKMRQLRIRAQVCEQMKKSNGPANGRIIYTSIPWDRSDEYQTFMIGDGDSSGEQIRAPVGVTARGPPS